MPLLLLMFVETLRANLLQEPMISCLIANSLKRRKHMLHWFAHHLATLLLRCYLCLGFLAEDVATLPLLLLLVSYRSELDRVRGL